VESAVNSRRVLVVAGICFIEGLVVAELLEPLEGILEEAEDCSEGFQDAHVRGTS
jgi:hypothetical protein